MVASVLTLIAIGMDSADSLARAELVSATQINRPAEASENQRLAFTIQITQTPPT
jgi:hypothetical protein